MIGPADRPSGQKGDIGSGQDFLLFFRFLFFCLSFLLSLWLYACLTVCLPVLFCPVCLMLIAHHNKTKQK